MLKEVYQNYKKIYPNDIIFIKSGNFFLTFYQDAYVMNELFHYKLIKANGYIKVGFPLIAFNKIIKKLEELQINYLIHDSDIIDRQKYKNNNYKQYLKENQYELLFYRINTIHKILNDNIMNSNIKIILDEIEKIVCKINY